MLTATQTESIVLYYKEGSSDKEYRCSIEPAGTGFVVNFAFGRRGSTLQTGSKTASPVSHDDARRIYDKLIREKTAKGYAPPPELAQSRGDTPPAPYQGTPREARVTGVLPQLLNPIDETRANLLVLDPQWWAQEKFDGKRVLVLKSGGTITGINRNGLVIALPTPVVEHAQRLSVGHCLLDGEAIGDTLIAFDLLEYDGHDLRGEPYNHRLKTLYSLAAVGGSNPGAIRAAGTAIGTDSKRALLATLRRDRKEGVVFKRHDAPYTPGRPASGGPALKLKYTASASCLVVGTNGSKRSVALELLDATGSRRIGVGSVTIPGRQPIPGAGSVIEVRYLYAFPSGALFQPVYLGIRDDIAPGGCTVQQLKFKPATDDGDSES